MGKLVKAVGSLFGGGGGDNNDAQIKQLSDQTAALNKQNADIANSNEVARQAQLKQDQEAQQQKAIAAQLKQNMETNATALSNTNAGTPQVANVQAGGTADALAISADELRKKKKLGGGLASTLGINA